MLSRDQGRHLNRAVVNPIIDPVLRDLKPLGDLGHGEVARDVRADAIDSA